jgi:hypothetical protein
VNPRPPARAAGLSPPAPARMAAPNPGPPVRAAATPPTGTRMAGGGHLTPGPAGGTGEGKLHSRLAGPGFHPAAAAMSERDLENGVRRILADLPSLLAYHPWVSVKSKSGYPDWTITGRWVMYRELKTAKGRLTKAQEAWHAALANAGADVDVWRPSDLLSGRVARELAELAGLTGGGDE